MRPKRPVLATKRQLVEAGRGAPKPTFSTQSARIGTPTTLRAAFADELRRTWADARAERPVTATQQARAEAVEARRVAALSDRERQIEAARFDLVLAQHNDTHHAHQIIAEASARLRAIELAA